jgi:hypothetical protein
LSAKVQHAYQGLSIITKEMEMKTSIVVRRESTQLMRRYALLRFKSAWCFAALIIFSLILPIRSAHAQAWLLTQAERKAYLQYYAPLIMQRAEEGSGKRGRDWIANYDFDRDGNFANNRYTWANLLSQYVAGASAGSTAYQHWRIRPTLYSSVIEYMEGGSKNLVLLYHVYHPVDKKASEIHDWERIEIAVRSVAGIPGAAGEYVAYAALTRHKDHILRQYGSPDLNFMEVTGGKHLMIWQADEDGAVLFFGGDLGAHGHELRFVQDSYATISARVATNATSGVNISNADRKSVHYLWVPETSANAVSVWGAQSINYSSATNLASGRDDSVRWSSVKRITYELQDLADVFQSQWSGSNWSINWTADKTVDVQLESALVDELGMLQVPAGLQRFYVGSRDSYSSSQTDGRGGVPSKAWFWGGYSAEANADTVSGSDKLGGYEALGRGSDNYNRADASGDYASLNTYWRQHDYFAHSGLVDTRDRYESGYWLRAGWQLWQNGGYDGRWAQLFDDRVAYEPVSPLWVSMPSYAEGCGEPVYATAIVGGGQAPYVFQWSNTLWQSPDGLWALVGSDQTATLSVTSADGQGATLSFTNFSSCPSGGGDPGGGGGNPIP